MTKLPYTDTFSITGRGTVYVVDRRDLEADISVGEEILVDNVPRTIRSIEAFRRLFGDGVGNNIGVLLEETS